MANRMIGHTATQRRLNPEDYFINRIDRKNAQIEMAKGGVGRKKFHHTRMSPNTILVWSPNNKSGMIVTKTQTNITPSFSRQSGSSVNRRPHRKRKA